jgi:hypothetical protein
MKAKEAKEARRVAPRPHAAAPKPAPKPTPGYWLYVVAGAVAAALAFWAYSPALHGAFLFDDTVMPYALRNPNSTLLDWLRSVRPATFFSYWVNNKISPDDPFSFHVLSVMLHCVTSGLMLFVMRRLLRNREHRDLLAGFAAAVFLMHPVQTEAVAYLAGRSEALSVMFFYAAFAVFLYRQKPAVSWGNAVAVLFFFGLGLLSKEHTIALPALLLLTDYWWNPGFSLAGIRANWKLYVPIALGALGGVAMFWRLIVASPSAGFGLKDLPWYQYFFTQWRALFVYPGTFLFPVHLNMDWDFQFSRTPFDRGAIIGLVALVAICAVAWRYRRQFPLASYGWFMFLILMAPTSSIIPIRDAVADRRLYLSMPGLLLIVLEFVSRWKVDRKALAAGCAVVMLLAMLATHARAALWGNPLELWQDTVEKSPGKSRPHFQLGLTYFDAGRPDLAVAEYEKTAKLDPPTYGLFVDWALALDKLNQMDAALDKLRQAATIKSTAHVWTQIAVVYAERGRWKEAREALDTAERLDDRFAPVYVYRGNIFLKQTPPDPCAAIREYKHALMLDQFNAEAQRNLQLAQLQSRGACP